VFWTVPSSLEAPVILVADAHYASRKVIVPLLAAGHHLVTRVRKNTVAYQPTPRPTCRRRGRPRLHGQRVYVRDLLRDTAAFVSVPSPVYGGHDATISYRCVDLL
jgi:hypothetical protein